jgi:hypothetical protein
MRFKGSQRKLEMFLKKKVTNLLFCFSFFLYDHLCVFFFFNPCVKKGDSVDGRDTYIFLSLSLSTYMHVSSYASS